MAEPSDVAGKVDHLAKLLTDIQAVEAQGRSIRRLLMIGVLLFLLLFGWLFYQKGQMLVSDAYREKVGTLTQERLRDKHLHTRIRNETQILLDRVQKPVSDAFAKRLQMDSPLYVQALNREGDILLQSLPAQLEKRVNAHYELMLQEAVIALEKEVPEMRKEKFKEEIIGNVALAMTTLAKKYYLQPLDKETNELLASWRDFPAAKRTRPGEQPLDDQLVDELLSLMWFQLAELSPQRN